MLDHEITNDCGRQLHPKQWTVCAVLYSSVWYRRPGGPSAYRTRNGLDIRLDTRLRRKNNHSVETFQVQGRSYESKKKKEKIKLSCERFTGPFPALDHQVPFPRCDQYRHRPTKKPLLLLLFDHTNKCWNCLEEGSARVYTGCCCLIILILFWVEQRNMLDRYSRQTSAHAVIILVFFFFSSSGGLGDLIVLACCCCCSVGKLARPDEPSTGMTQWKRRAPICHGSDPSPFSCYCRRHSQQGLKVKLN